MAADESETKYLDVPSLRDMNLREEEADEDVAMGSVLAMDDVKREQSARASATSSGSGTPNIVKRGSRSPFRGSNLAESPAVKSEQEDEVVGGDVTLKIEPGKPPRLSRTNAHKIEKRPPPLFLDYEDKTEEARQSFGTLTECVYANKYMGSTEPALECDCSEEWDSSTRTNDACGPDSDCINRATKMECIGDCGCGANCQNQRFQHKQYANVSVIKTEKKGYGLRTNSVLQPDQFIFEYVGDVIGEQSFRKRMRQYDDDGIKHFYFMSLTKGEFVDATKRGNLGRFCNHSCNPNCYVDKWVVGDKLRMGIFAERKIQAGEELVFNYNVDRYGADPQPCYCGEPNCTGYIGGKTQTERSTKLSNAIIEALGIEDADAWDTAVARKPRKKKSSEDDDEEYVNNVEPRGLDEDGVNKVMSSLMQCKEKWIAVKLLSRIQRAEDDKVRNRVVRFHGYRIMKTVLSNFADDVNVCLQVLEILDAMPRLTRNKVQDSKIEEAVAPLKESEDERVSSKANGLMKAWSKLEVAYRIPRMKRDPNTILPDRKSERVDRRDGERRRSRSRTRSNSPVLAPSGPRGNAASRGGFGGPRPPRFKPPPPTGALPQGWFEATAANGSVYYYNQAGTTTWQRPSKPAAGAPPPPPLKAISDQQMLQDLIKNIVASKKETPKPASVAGTPAENLKPERKEDKWRSYSEEKRKKLYEATIQPHIMHVVGKFKQKLAKEDLKRWAKELAKKMVESDFRKGKVENPTKISDKQIKGIKKHAQEFFEKAAKKKADADKRKADKRAALDGASNTPIGSPAPIVASPIDKDMDQTTFSDNEQNEPEATPAESSDGTSGLKRRLEEVMNGETSEETESILKKLRTESDHPPPPPPPPPPVETTDEMDESSTPLTDEAKYNTVAFEANSANGIPGEPWAPDQRDGRFGEPSQTATPPTTGSPDLQESEKFKEGGQHAGVTVDTAP
ncbi:Hypothetical protein R9X50_00691900 [Acrodontium crateriforme]|uniref:Histone-lysine N-methyltransferase, H3 lysine-36 specific n=1 Tax=Acrodontium crateriforme TaxID=150365 RepID=A0AAQ3RCF8_9PEZI|nr:Hypothetical protein R9X50_00691900 [Acrodontium crateriforme]